jgi:hypothetical protein
VEKYVPAGDHPTARLFQPRSALSSDAPTTAKVEEPQLKVMFETSEEVLGVMTVPQSRRSPFLAVDREMSVIVSPRLVGIVQRRIGSH